MACRYRQADLVLPQLWKMHHGVSRDYDPKLQDLGTAQSRGSLVSSGSGLGGRQKLLRPGHGRLAIPVCLGRCPCHPMKRCFAYSKTKTLQQQDIITGSWGGWKSLCPVQYLSATVFGTSEHMQQQMVSTQTAGGGEEGVMGGVKVSGFS